MKRAPFCTAVGALGYAVTCRDVKSSRVRPIDRQRMDCKDGEPRTRVVPVGSAVYAFENAATSAIRNIAAEDRRRTSRIESKRIDGRRTRWKAGVDGRPIRSSIVRFEHSPASGRITQIIRGVNRRRRIDQEGGNGF